MQALKITLVQTDIAWQDAAANRAHLSAKFAAASLQTDLILLPETFSTGFSMRPDLLAESMEGPTVKWMQEMAKRYACTLAGSLIIQEDGKFYNRLMWVNEKAEIEYYDKQHLFRLGEEFKYFTAGERRKIVKLKDWSCCLNICYDLRFPVWSRNRYENGEYEYDLLLYVANWPVERAAVWKALLPARAIENQAFVLAVNRIGMDANGFDHQGDSMIVDPYGAVVEELGHQESIKTVDITADKLLKTREKFEVGKDWDSFTMNPTN